jgi:hypothetical protein
LFAGPCRIAYVTTRAPLGLGGTPHATDDVSGLRRRLHGVLEGALDHLRRRNDSAKVALDARVDVCVVMRFIGLRAATPPATLCSPQMMKSVDHQ